MKPTPLLLILLLSFTPLAHAEFFDLEQQSDALIIGDADKDEMGNWVAPAGDFNGDGLDDFIVGAPGHDRRFPEFRRGRVALFYGRPGGARPSGSLTAANADVVFTGAADYQQAGAQIASAGDVNGDGYDDLLIATERTSGTGDNVHLIYGRDDASISSDFDLANADVTFKYEVPGDQYSFGTHFQSFYVSSGGDVNGDGYDEVMIGALFSGGRDEGKTYLFYGQPEATALSGEIDMTAADATFVGNRERGYLGQSIASAGDVNGDGYDDLLLGMPNSLASRNRGTAHLFYGGEGDAAPTGVVPISEADVEFRGAANGDHAGWSVSSAGDVNGDGLDDVLVAAFQADPLDRENVGAVHLVYGKQGEEELVGRYDLANADVTIAGAYVDEVYGGDALGRSVASAGDIDGDGLADIIVAAADATRVGQPLTGEVYLVYGSTLGELSGGLLDARNADVTFGRRVSFQDLNGRSVAGAGDIDGDGLDDLLVGAPKARFRGFNREGAAYLIYGSTLVPEPAALFLLVIGLTVMPTTRRGRFAG